MKFAREELALETKPHKNVLKSLDTSSLNYYSHNLFEITPSSLKTY